MYADKKAVAAAFIALAGAASAYALVGWYFGLRPPEKARVVSAQEMLETSRLEAICDLALGQSERQQTDEIVRLACGARERRERGR